MTRQPNIPNPLLAARFPSFVLIDFGQCGENCPYWAITQALAFEHSSTGHLIGLFPEYDDQNSYTDYLTAQQELSPVDRPRYFGGWRGNNRLEVEQGLDGNWLVIGHADQFNPHFWESSVLPNADRSTGVDQLYPI